MKRSNTLAGDGKWDRRSALRAAAVLAGAAATAPLLGGPAMAQAGPSGDADALFKAGKFEQAGRAYEEILRTGPHEPARGPPARLCRAAGQPVPRRREIPQDGHHAGARRQGRQLLPGRLLHPAGQVLPVRTTLASGRRGQLRQVVRGGPRRGVSDPRRHRAGAMAADGPDAAGGGLGQRRTAEALHVLHRRPESGPDRDGSQGSRAEPRRQSEDRLRERHHLGVLRDTGVLQAGRHRTAQHPRGLVVDGVGRRCRHRPATA